MELSEIRATYQNIPTERLIVLVNELEDLEFNTIAILSEELEKRGEHESVKRILKFVENQKNQKNDHSFEELSKEVSARLHNGESIQSIEIDLKDRGVDYDKFLMDGVEIDEKNQRLDAYGYAKVAEAVLEMRSQNISNVEIKDTLSGLGVNEQDSEEIITESSGSKEAFIKNTNKTLKQTKNKDLLFGSIIFGVGMIVTIGTISSGRGYVVAYGAIIVGLIRIIRGLSSTKLKK